MPWVGICDFAGESITSEQESAKYPPSRPLDVDYHRIVHRSVLGTHHLQPPTTHLTTSVMGAMVIQFVTIWGVLSALFRGYNDSTRWFKPWPNLIPDRWRSPTTFQRVVKVHLTIPKKGTKNCQVYKSIFWSPNNVQPAKFPMDFFLPWIFSFEGVGSWWMSTE